MEHAGHPPARTASPRKAWLIVTLLFLVQVVNYADKTVMALAAPSIMRELKLSAAQYGLVASSFFSLYAVAGLFVGFVLAPRFPPRRIMTILLVIWSVAQLPIVLSASLGVLIACRVTLGAGEGGGTPTAMNVAHEWFPADRRNMPTAVVTLGTSIGSLLAAPLLSYVIVAFGWRMAFLTCSMIGLVVLMLWLAIADDGPESEFRADRGGTMAQSPITQAQLWRDPAIIGSFMAQSAAYWIIGFSVAWLPPFVIQALGYGQISGGWMLSVTYGVQSVFWLAIAWTSQRMLQRGRSSRQARGTLNGWCLFAAGLCFAGVAVVSEAILRVALIASAIGFSGATFTLNPALLSEIAPEGHRNRLINVMMAIITIAAIVSPAVAGRLIQSDPVGGWARMLWVNAGICMVGAAAAFALLHPERARRRFAALKAAAAVPTA